MATVRTVRVEVLWVKLSQRRVDGQRLQRRIRRDRKLHDPIRVVVTMVIAYKNELR